jgi:succinate-semialdehyde dehydrogenase/glutarate-semialdehyde dehydrogenase
MIEVIDPATGAPIRSYEEMDDESLNETIFKAQAAFNEWKKTSFAERARLMREAARILDEEKESYAMMITREMGKRLTEAISEVEKCSWVCLYYAQHAEQFLDKEFVTTDASKSYISYRPMGVILAVMPWNFPFWQVFRFAAPALMAGNAALLKHASNVPGCAIAIEEVFQKAGFPEDLFSTLMISSDKVEQVIANRVVKGVTLTGSEKAGSAVAATAGKHIKKTVLELGGSDPYLILEDADIKEAVKICVKSRLLNNGQSCIGAKRFIVVRQVYNEFLEQFKAEMEKANMGDPLDENTRLGPMAREDLRDDLHQQVTKSIELGAECILGGEIPDMPGAYYPATILTNVKKGSPAYEEELFGPVASIIQAWDEEEAILIANDTPYGLGAAVFTQNLDRGEKIANEHLEAGCCFINAMVKSDPRLPFGGIKASGYGRELSFHGVREFTNTKTVYVK